jgi:BlaI family penicillinase repressor
MGRFRKEQKQLKLGKVQLEIMGVLWREGQATAREVTNSLSLVKPIAHSTVQTLLRDLEAKGALTHDRRDRTFTFRPIVQRDEVLTSSVQDMLKRVFHGSAYELVSHLLKEEQIDLDELARLKELIERHEREAKNS